MESKNMGYQFSSICLSPFLCAGTTFVFFHSRGNFPLSRHDLNIKERHHKVLPAKYLSYDHGLYLGQGF